jgi:TRAP-type C4-dicarboxylate transport system permease large subunit
MYAILGCIMESFSMMITTIPIVTPLVVGLGIDPVWFGVFLILLTELALITPPVGINLFVIQGIRPPGTNISDVIVGATPFTLGLFLMIVIIVYFPELVLWLPNKLYG